MKVSMINMLLENTDNVFFYCIKRCNNRFDAEDLSQTILLKAMIAINKGIEPLDFNAYIWGIARNEYAKYVSGKASDREKLVYDDSEIVDVGDSNLDSLINKEKLDFIKREIKLLSQEYITILYRYYVEDMKLGAIAEELNLPLGTVKYKLYQIRKKLTEAIKMERLNGKKTYIPENYQFQLSCSKVGIYNPWNYVNTLLNKNLLFHSYNNPCTLEDYALELGISLPYIEDIVVWLEEATLLKRIDKKYLTNFAFISKEQQMKIEIFLLSFKEKIGNKVVQFAEMIFPEFVKIGFEGNDLPKGKLMWILLSMTSGMIEELSDCKYKYTKRPDGAWDFLGFEEYQNQIFFVGQDTSGNYYRKQVVYNIHHPRIMKRKIGPYEEIDTLYLLNHKFSRNYQELMNSNDDVRGYVKTLLDKNLIRIVDNQVKFNFAFFNKDQYDAFKTLLKGKEMEDILSIYNHIFMLIKELITLIIPSYLDSQIYYICDTWLSNIRSLVLMVAEEKEILDFAENEKVFPYNMMMVKM